MQARGGYEKDDKGRKERRRGGGETKKNQHFYILIEECWKKTGDEQKRKILEDVNIVVSEILFKMKLNEN